VQKVLWVPEPLNQELRKNHETPGLRISSPARSSARDLAPLQNPRPSMSKQGRVQPDPGKAASGRKEAGEGRTRQQGAESMGYEERGGADPAAARP
jgi:hypothetical protein